MWWDEKKKWYERNQRWMKRKENMNRRNVMAWFVAARSTQWKLMIFFDSKKCILLQHTCGISIATMIASEKGLGAGAGVRYSSTRRIRIQQRKNTHLLAVTIVCSRINTCRVVAIFPFFLSFFLFFCFVWFPSFLTRTDHKKIRI